MFHIRSSSPVVVDVTSGRQVLRNPTWCGVIDLPSGEAAAHIYGLAPDTVTCPTCHHLYTCPHTGTDTNRAERCQVCEHIDECADQTCRDNHHPGIVSPPAPAAARAARQPGRRGGSPPHAGATIETGHTVDASPPPRAEGPEADPEQDRQRAARAALAYLFDPGEHLADLITTAGGPQAAYHQLRHDGGRPDGLRVELAGAAPEQLWHHADHITHTVAAAGFRMVVPGDQDWPARLPDLATTTTASARAGEQPPGVLCLFVHGTAPVAGLLARSVAVTGTRAATAYGTNAARDLGHGCTVAGCTVVSSGGYGCDAAAHRGALVAGGATVAVLPAGLDRPHPPRHQRLFEQIVDQGGLLVSAYPPGVPATRLRAAATRQLLATLATATVMVEAPRHSSSLPTLLHAHALGRAAMVVPGPVTSAASAGCHQALRDNPQLRLVTSTADVLNELQAATTAEQAHHRTHHP